MINLSKKQQKSNLLYDCWDFREKRDRFWDVTVRWNARSNINNQFLQFLICIQIPFSFLILNPNFLFHPPSSPKSRILCELLHSRLLFVFYSYSLLLLPLWKRVNPLIINSRTRTVTSRLQNSPNCLIPKLPGTRFVLSIHPS